MPDYKPRSAFTTPLVLLQPTTQKVSGVKKKVYPNIQDGMLFYASFKTYGGTERDINGVYSIEDTASVECLYMPEIKSDCVVAFPDTNARYEIMGEPENISMRNQFLKFKVKRIKGGA